MCSMRPTSRSRQTQWDNGILYNVYYEVVLWLTVTCRHQATTRDRNPFVHLENISSSDGCSDGIARSAVGGMAKAPPKVTVSVNGPCFNHTLHPRTLHPNRLDPHIAA